MNLKKDLVSLGYYLITPVPSKYHFEGVSNRRAGLQLVVVSALLPMLATAVVIEGPKVVAKVRETIYLSKFKKYPVQK